MNALCIYEITLIDEWICFTRPSVLIFSDEGGGFSSAYRTKVQLATDFYKNPDAISICEPCRTESFLDTVDLAGVPITLTATISQLLPFQDLGFSRLCKQEVLFDSLFVNRWSASTQRGLLASPQLRLAA